jgi:WD40 repeat protein
MSLLQRAIRLCAHVVATDKTQLASQLLGRLSTDTLPEIATLRQQAAQWRGAPWLRPLAALLTAPGGALLFTLTGHTARVRAVVVSTNGRYAVSASDDHTVKIWDLARGVEERTLIGHTDWVRAVAVTPDALRVVSAADDHTLKIWSLETGETEKTMNWLRVFTSANTAHLGHSGSHKR